MIKDALADGGLSVLAAFGLLVFVGVFLGVTAWALTRRRREVRRWSNLPLADGPRAAEPRRDRANSPLPVVSGGAGCGRCENCSC